MLQKTPQILRGISAGWREPKRNLIL